jgi:glycosyltransferase involved in cell wall biosynthesis
MKVLLVRNGAGDADECAVLARRQVPLLQELSMRGVQPVVALFGDPGGLHSELLGGGIDARLFRPGLPPSGTSLPRLPEAIVALDAMIQEVQPDLLEGDEPMPAIALGFAARRPRSAPVVYRRHHHGGRPRVHAASRLAATLADWTMVSCEAMRQHANTTDHTPPDRIAIASSGTIEPRPHALADIAAQRAALGIAPDARVILCISQLRRQKGVDILIRAVDYLAGSGDVHLLIAGSGIEAGSLRRLADRALRPVHFLGHRNDIDRWLALADVVVMPSRNEAFGRVTLETMAAGRPLIGTRVGGLSEAIVDGENGLLVREDDPVDLADSIRAVLAQPSLAGRLAAAARASYEAKYTIAHMAAAWHEAWLRVLAVHGGAVA